MQQGDVLSQCGSGQLLKRRKVGTSIQPFVIASAEKCVAIGMIDKPFPQILRRSDVTQNMVHAAPAFEIGGKPDRLNPDPIPVLRLNFVHEVFDGDHGVSLLSSESALQGSN